MAFFLLAGAAALGLYTLSQRTGNGDEVARGETRAVCKRNFNALSNTHPKNLGNAFAEHKTYEPLHFIADNHGRVHV